MQVSFENVYTQKTLELLTDDAGRPVLPKPTSPHVLQRCLLDIFFPTIYMHSAVCGLWMANGKVQWHGIRQYQHMETWMLQWHGQHLQNDITYGTAKMETKPTGSERQHLLCWN